MTGRQFEDYIVKLLGEHGYWVHRLSPDETGQQPFDIIALKGNVVYAYDAKVLSNGKRFPLSRVEDNQITAFDAFEKKVSAMDVGCLIYSGGEIRFLNRASIKYAIKNDISSIDVRQLPVWRIL